MSRPRRPTLEEAVASNMAAPFEETVLSHTDSSSTRKNTIEARVVIGFRDKDGNEWEYNGCRKFRLKPMRRIENSR